MNHQSSVFVIPNTFEMDKNTLLGFVLIGIVVIGFSWLNRPSPEQVELRRRAQDSIAFVESLREQEAIRQAQANTLTTENTLEEVESDSLRQIVLQQNYGAFAANVEGDEEFTTLSNELMTITLSNKGGRIVSSQLTQYRTHDSLPLYLFDKGDADYGFTLVTANNRVVQTNALYFSNVARTDSSVTMRLQGGEESYLDFVYTLKPNSYMASFEIKSQGMNSVLSGSTSYLDFFWNARIRQQEKGQKFEDRYTQIYYKYMTDEVKYLSESKEEKETIANRVKWISYKDQFFSTVLIAEEGMTGVTLETRPLPTTVNYLKDFNSIAAIDYNPAENKTLAFRWYMGPNHYPTLKSFDKGVEGDKRLDLEKMVPLGWGIFRWVNTYFIIPLFNFFGKFIGNYGIIILLLTLVVRIVISPLSYKSYMSSAKMRLLKPQIEEIGKKYPGQEKAMDKQRAIMDLYGKAGASPMSGCLPMLLQMPILFAMFSFFPSSIELRQESFLWAKDLSTYDAIVSWQTHIPIVSEYFGNHISLFCLLMTITSMVYTKYNMDATNTGQEQMPGMKVTMYLMPLMFLVFFNQYASGLSYYYFLASLFSIVEKFVFSKVVNDKKLLATMQANAANSHNKKKSGFWARVAEAQKQQQASQNKKQQKGKR